MTKAGSRSAVETAKVGRNRSKDKSPSTKVAEGRISQHKSKRPKPRDGEGKGPQGKGPRPKAQKTEPLQPKGDGKSLDKILKEVQESLDAKKLFTATKTKKSSKINGRRFEVSDAKTLAAINSVKQQKTKKRVLIAPRGSVKTGSKVSPEGNPVFRALLQEKHRLENSSGDDAVTETVDDIQRLMKSLGEPLDPKEDQPGVLGGGAPSRKSKYGEEQYIAEEYPEDPSAESELDEEKEADD